MADHNDTGQFGEMRARQYLEEHDYAILETNYRLGRLEADIIAYTEGVIVFVEVKTRSSVDHGNPEDFVDRNKQRAYIKLANHYVLEHQRIEEVRFDIISVITGDNGIQVEHIADAFSAVDLHR